MSGIILTLVIFRRFHDLVCKLQDMRIQETCFRFQCESAIVLISQRDQVRKETKLKPKMIGRLVQAIDDFDFPFRIQGRDLFCSGAK